MQATQVKQTDFRTGSIERKRAKISYRVLEGADDKPAIAFGPGMACHSDLYVPIALLLRHLYEGKIVLLQNRGMGDSQRGITHSDFYMNDLAEDTKEVLDAEGIKRAIMVPHSMHAIPSTRLAAENHGKVAGVFYVCPAFGNPLETWAFGKSDWTIGLSDAFAVFLWHGILDAFKLSAGSMLTKPIVASLLTGRPIFKTNGDAIGTAFDNLAHLDTKTMGIALRALLSQNGDTLEMLKHLDIPVRIVAGKRDLLVGARKLAKQLEKAGKRLDTIHFSDDFGHVPMLERPRELAHAIAEFANGINTNGAATHTSQPPPS